MKQRIVTGVLGGSFALVVLWAGGWWFAGLVVMLATIGYIEFCRMRGIGLNRIPTWVGLIVVWLLLVYGMAEHQLISKGLFRAPENVLIGFILFLFLIVGTGNRFKVDEAAYMLFGSLYIGFGFSYMIQTRLMEDGLTWSLMVILVTWASDSGAYFIGKQFGRRKLWPSISPNKTVEGHIGGLILSLAVSGLFALFLPELATFSVFLLIGLVVSVVGQLGDLAESAIKRSHGVKDSGNLLPGHGGILDRFDSLLLVFPVLYLVHLF